MLAGVSVEVNDTPTNYTIVLPASSEAGPDTLYIPPSKKGAAQPVITAPQTIPTFNTIEALNNFCSTWKELGLTKTASKAVLGSGKTSAPALMVICDIPDDSEDRQGIAFSSPTARLVRQALMLAGMAEKNIYFTYLSKWRTPAKRPLTPLERDICNQILNQEIALVAPKLILTLGESTVKTLNPEFAQNLGKGLADTSYTNQLLKNKIPLKAFHKGEFLVKNPLIKKSFWFGLLDLADTIRANDRLSPGAPDINNAE